MGIFATDSMQLVPLLALGLVMAGAGLLVLRWTRFADKRQARLTTAQPAEAKITRIGKLYAWKNDPHTCAFVELQVQPRWGHRYDTGAAWKIDPAHLKELQAGKNLRVKVDAKRPGTIYPDVPWAEYDWANEDVTQEKELR